MNVLDAITNRRSVRSYQNTIPEDELINEILTAGTLAPSGGNRQPWKFILIKNNSTIDLITRFSPGFAHHPTKPPIIIAVCSNSVQYGSTELAKMKAIMDTYLSVENIVLAAVSLGLGTVVVRSFPEKVIKDILSIPEKIDLALLVGLGYPNTNEKKRDKKPLMETLYIEKYGVKKN
jgi:nitroreductase